VPLQDVVAEHRMYLPSVGLFFIVAWLFNRSQIVIFCCCVLLFFAANLIHRNHDWRSKISLWEDTVKKSPKKARPFINLAHAYQKSEHLEEAIINYKKAAARDRGYFPIHHNLGVLYKGMGRCELAEEEYRLALILKPNSGESMVGLAECFSQAGKYHLAVQMLEKVLRVGPRLGSAYRVLGKINYFHLGQKEIGKDYFRKALALDPTHEQNSILKNLVGNEPK